MLPHVFLFAILLAAFRTIWISTKRHSNEKLLSVSSVERKTAIAIAPHSILILFQLTVMWCNGVVSRCRALLGLFARRRNFITGCQLYKTKYKLWNRDKSRERKCVYILFEYSKYTTLRSQTNEMRNIFSLSIPDLSFLSWRVRRIRI